jgi:hypothetical protein
MRLTILFLTVFLWVGCSSKKKLAVDEADVDELGLIVSIETANAKPQSVHARGKGSFKGMGFNQGFKVDLRHQLDSIIWVDVSAAMLGIKVARVMITPDSVFFYNKLEKTYLKSTVSDLQKLLGGPVSFDDLQAMLTGRPLRYPTVTKGLKKERGAWLYAVNSSERQMAIRFDADDYKLLSQDVLFPSAQQSITATYSGYSEIIPLELFFSSKVEGNDLRLRITFDKIESSTSITYPFSIPRGYKSL